MDKSNKSLDGKEKLYDINCSENHISKTKTVKTRGRKGKNNDYDTSIVSDQPPLQCISKSDFKVSTIVFL